MAKVFLSIGSNVDKAGNICAGVELLRQQFGELQLSPVYENAAVGFEGDSFYNLVAGLETEQSIQQVATTCRQIEEQRGRDRSAPKFSSRSLDIDLLLYDDVVIEDGSMDVPRGEITRYAFVLKPLVDVAPDFMHPVLNKRMTELWDAFSGERAMQVVDLGF